MKREDVFLMYKILVQMRDFADKLDEAIKLNDFERASQLKQKIIELQGSLRKIL